MTGWHGGGFAARFWGVRGSIPTPRADSVRYGGNTTCLQIALPGFDEPLILDAGSGIREFGRIPGESPSGIFHLLMSHFHWDHVQGLPFFAPLYNPAVQLHIYSGREGTDTEQIFRGQMTTPYFPVPFDATASRRNYVRLAEPELHIGPAKITTFPLNHPQGCLGFRIEAGGKVLVHVCDHEHGNQELDAGVIRAASGADVLIYDAQYTPEEYEARRGWGHSTWREGVRISEAAGVKRLYLTHHDPTHSDEFLDDLVRQARAAFGQVDAASENSVVQL